MPIKQINDNGTVFDIGQDQVTEDSVYPVKSSGIYNFVNSSVSTNTANFVGTYNSLADLEAHTDYQESLTNNDYGFVISTDSEGNTVYSRYKYNAENEDWMFEYNLNNSSFTANQWQTINSGLTSSDKSQIQNNTTSISNLQTEIKNKSASTSLAPAYDSSHTYTDGELMTKDGDLYIADSVNGSYFRITNILDSVSTPYLTNAVQGKMGNNYGEYTPTSGNGEIYNIPVTVGTTYIVAGDMTGITVPSQFVSEICAVTATNTYHYNSSYKTYIPLTTAGTTIVADQPWIYLSVNVDKRATCGVWTVSTQKFRKIDVASIVGNINTVLEGVL